MLVMDLDMVARMSPLPRYAITLTAWWTIEDNIRVIQQSLRDNTAPRPLAEAQQLLVDAELPRRLRYEAFCAAGEAAREWLKKEQRLSGIDHRSALELAPLLIDHMPEDVRGPVITMAALLVSEQRLGRVGGSHLGEAN